LDSEITVGSAYQETSQEHLSWTDHISGIFNDYEEIIEILVKVHLNHGLLDYLVLELHLLVVNLNIQLYLTLIVWVTQGSDLILLVIIQQVTSN
jgi:hypothetical protein